MVIDNKHGTVLQTTGHTQSSTPITATPRPTKTATPKPASTATPKPIYTGDIVTFGNYYQSNGYSKEPIQWQVLQMSGSKAMLISRYALDSQPYNDTLKNVTWATCSLRSWLNNTFYYAAFSGEERRCIQQTYVDNSTSQHHQGHGGNDTYDYVYLLSSREAFRYFTKGTSSAWCGLTAYAISQGAWTPNEEYVNGHPTGKWQTRSPGKNAQYAAYINHDGTFGQTGIKTYSNGIRPVIWVDLSYGYVKK